jgi:hypothetical protein
VNGIGSGIGEMRHFRPVIELAAARNIKALTPEHLFNGMEPAFFSRIGNVQHEKQRLVSGDATAPQVIVAIGQR